MVEWKPVVGYEDRYEVSDLGEVVAIERTYIRGCVIGTYPRRVLSQTVSGRDKSYRRVTLCRGKHKIKKLVHKIVAEAFLGPQPPQTVICHCNDKSDDNRVSNLYYGTWEQNMLDKYVNNLDLNSMESAPF